MIHWPAILKLENEDELFYLDNQSELLNQLQAHYLTDSTENYLIDIKARLYELDTNRTNLYRETASAKPMLLQTFNQLVRNHLSARQQCCVLKINIESFEQGFRLVFDTAED